MSTLSFHNFSWKGDPKWWNASSWTGYGPIVVCVIFAIAVVQVVCGSIWIVQLGNHLTVYAFLRSFVGTFELLPYLQLALRHPQTHDHTDIAHTRLFLLQRHPFHSFTHAAPQ